MADNANQPASDTSAPATSAPNPTRSDAGPGAAPATAEHKAREDNIKSIQLAIRETQDAAVQLFTNKGYAAWGENPYYAFINGSFVKGIYFFKNL